MRRLTYCQAINEALVQEMDRDDRVFVYGIGAPDHKEVFGTLAGIADRWPDRCLDTPLSEDTLLGFGLGAAMGGLRPVNVHIRVDFLVLALNQLLHIAAPHHYLTGEPLPIVIRAIVGRGWGQGCHHSKSLHSLFAHIPGLKVYMPFRPEDAKGLLIAAIRDPNPVVFLEHRWLYWAEGDVPEEPYTTEAESRVLRPGGDLTVIATSWMCAEALHAADILNRQAGLEIEVVDLCSASPMRMGAIYKSVRKTGLVIIADNDWVQCGLGAEIASLVTENCWTALQAPPIRIGFGWSPCPTERGLENAFYPNAKTIIQAILELKPYLEWEHDINLDEEEFYAHERRFHGPF